MDDLLDKYQYLATSVPVSDGQYLGTYVPIQEYHGTSVSALEGQYLGTPVSYPEGQYLGNIQLPLDDAATSEMEMEKQVQNRSCFNYLQCR